MQEQLPTTAWMQEIEQCRSNCRDTKKNRKLRVLRVFVVNNFYLSTSPPDLPISQVTLLTLPTRLFRETLKNITTKITKKNRKLRVLRVFVMNSLSTFPPEYPALQKLSTRHEFPSL